MLIVCRAVDTSRVGTELDCSSLALASFSPIAFKETFGDNYDSLPTATLWWLCKLCVVPYRYSSFKLSYSMIGIFYLKFI